ncbi:Pfs domain protein [Xylogone sp. PMI_703]|nr:Pfs domain protein [Xylogone sp. PMI_703]
MEKHQKDYTVGWICASEVALKAAQALLDSTHSPLESQHKSDDNSYTLGSIGKHNVAITCLPGTGAIHAAVVSKSMQITFPNLRFGLLVGTGGGVPSDENDIRVGDVAVSLPTGRSGGVVQYDFGKMLVDGFQRLGTLNKPPILLRNAVIKPKISTEYRKGNLERNAKMWSYPTWEEDNLFKPTFHHNEHCPCKLSIEHNPEMIPRERRSSYFPEIFYGNIASGNMVMKNAVERDRLAKEDDIICFEMEAAGLMDHFPCLVIRGVSNYADSHKNDTWTYYASAVASAYAKKLLSVISPEAGSGPHSATGSE